MPRAISDQRETSQITADSRSSDATDPPTPAARTADGPEGNARLTASTGALLLILLAVEGVTILRVRQLTSVHFFVGLLLVPPVAVKLGSTGYRFMRYYTHDRAYRLKGPPVPALRLLAPILVASTVVVFATGVALALVGPPSRTLVLAHQVSFFVWLAVTGIHVLAYALEVPRLASADWRRTHGLAPVRGGRVRKLLLAGALVGGIILGTVILPTVGPWSTRLAYHDDRQRGSVGQTASRARLIAARAAP